MYLTPRRQVHKHRSLGLQGGVVRRAANADRDLRIIEGHAAGWSQRHLAKLFKLSQPTICYILRRALQGDR